MKENVIAIALVVIIFIALALLWLVRQFSFKSTRIDVALCGPSDSGKTALLLRLARGEHVESQTSKCVNTARIKVENRHLTVLDTPGHFRLSSESMKHIEKAKSLVFVIDSSDKQSFKAAAQQLVDLLMNKNVVDNCPAVLFLVNKSDLLESRNPELVMHFVQLETERILKAYKSESHMKKISPESMELLNRLAQEEFSMDKIPLSFKWCSGSVKTGELSHVHSFIEAIG